MTNKYGLLLIVSMLLLLASCKKEKETRKIITMTEEIKTNNEPQAMNDNVADKSFDWNGIVYRATIARAADKETVVKDDDGNKYFDNKVTLRVEGSNGAIIDRVFVKSDFTPYVNTNYLKPGNSALMGIAFNRVEGGNAIFVATIGTPDAMSDEFMSIQMTLAKSGSLSMSTLQEIQEFQEDEMTE